MPWTPLRDIAVVILLAQVVPAVDLRAQQPDLRRIRTRTGVDTAAVLLALLGAQRKLQSAECRSILTEFRDEEGRPLDERLASLDVQPVTYVNLLVILDGDGKDGGDACRRSGAMALTSPGSRVVRVCGGAFRAQSAGLRENTIIHEMLHSLGLGENPPTSTEINETVWRRCGW